MVAVFVQHTVSPCMIVTGSGENEKLAIVICVSPVWQVVPRGRVEEA
jgi:hypothetical protein